MMREDASPGPDAWREPGSEYRHETFMVLYPERNNCGPNGVLAFLFTPATVPARGGARV